jgi:hypothetical protein
MHHTIHILLFLGELSICMLDTEVKLTNPFDFSELSFDKFKSIIVNDYKIAYESRLWDLWRWKGISPTCNGQSV